MAETTFGWDVGGAHLKACRVQSGRVVDVAQWPCPLWQGLACLDAAFAQARARWPQAFAADSRHAATMSAEMCDLFASREDGVRRLAAQLAEILGPSLRLYAGEQGFVAAHHAPPHWAAIASANWHAGAAWLAARGVDGVFVDIGSTTTDLIVVCGGGVAARGRSDAERLASGELVYQGVVRTPLMALGPRVNFGGATVNVMNEVFATSADVYRLTGELDAAHDQHSTADGAAKDAAATRRRLARMIGRDAHEADAAEWLALAGWWRERQLDELHGQLRRVLDAAALPPEAPLVAAGCGDFLVRELARRSTRQCLPFASFCLDAAADPAVRGWAQVCAPAVAVALLPER